MLMVDHTFVYTNAVQQDARARRRAASSARSTTTTRCASISACFSTTSTCCGTSRSTISRSWISCWHSTPVAVSATGLAHVPGQPENIAYMTMFFDGQLIAHVHVNWLAPVKVRRTLLGGSRRMIVFDDLEASEKIKVYDRGISVNPEPGKRLPDARSAIAPATCGRRSLPSREALQTEASALRRVHRAQRRRRRPTDDAGLRVVRLLEAATRVDGPAGAARAGVASAVVDCDDSVR